jgi:hypothetical protein
MSKSKYPWRVVTVSVDDGCGTARVVAANGHAGWVTADDITKMNMACGAYQIPANSLQLSDLMGQDIRILLAVRSMRLGLVD